MLCHTGHYHSMFERKTKKVLWGRAVPRTAFGWAVLGAQFLELLCPKLAVIYNHGELHTRQKFKSNRKVPEVVNKSSK